MSDTENPTRFGELIEPIVSHFLESRRADAPSYRSIYSQANEAFRGFKKRYGEVDPNEEIMSDGLIGKWLGKDSGRPPPDHPTKFAAIIGLAYVIGVDKPILVALLTYVPTLAAYYDPDDPDAILRGVYKLACTKMGRADARALRDMIEDRWGDISEPPLDLNPRGIIRRRTKSRSWLLFVLAISMAVLLSYRDEMPFDADVLLGQQAAWVLKETGVTFLEIGRIPGPPVALQMVSSFPFRLALVRYVLLSDEGNYNYVCRIGQDPQSPVFLSPKSPQLIYPRAAQPDARRVSCWEDTMNDPPRGCELTLWWMDETGQPEQIIPDLDERSCPTPLN